KQLEDTKTELSLVKTEKKQIENSLSNLRIEYEKDKTEKDAEISKKDGELQRKEEQIKNLLRQKDLSQEELLTEKTNSRKRNLDLASSRLGINSERIHDLSKYHEKLFIARKNQNQTTI